MDFDVVLFDLDGTLLPVDFDNFLSNYFKAISAEFMDLASPEKFVEIILTSTRHMLDNDGSKLNKEVFEESFFSLVKVKNRDKIIKRFNTFYRDKFPLLGKDLKIDMLPVQLIELLKNRGYKLVIATNPVFPLEAVKERIRWLGINPSDFSLITSYETMHYCKPDLGFYREILGKLGLPAESCIMVGNNMQEDMVAEKLGIKTFLVEDFLIDNGKVRYNPYWRGTLKELLLFFKEKT